MESWAESVNEAVLRANSSPVAESVLSLLFAYLEECGSELSHHGWVNPNALLHDGRETAKTGRW